MQRNTSSSESLKLQRSLLKALRQAMQGRTTSEIEAETQKKQAQDSAAQRLRTIKESSAGQLQQAEEANRQGDTEIRRGDLMYSLARKASIPKHVLADTNLAVNLAASASAATTAHAAIRSNIEALILLREKQQSRKISLIVGISVSIVVLLSLCAIVSSWGFHTWQRNTQIEQLYQDAITSANAGNLDQAALKIVALQKLEPNYKNLDNYVASQPTLQREVRTRFLLDKGTVRPGLSYGYKSTATYPLAKEYAVVLDSISFDTRGTALVGLELSSSDGSYLEKPSAINLIVSGE